MSVNKKNLPKLAAFDWQGCFALTEPLSGSDIAGGLATTAERVGDKMDLEQVKNVGSVDQTQLTLFQYSLATLKMDA